MTITINNQQTSRTTTNGTSYTLASYTPTSGSDAVLVVRASGLRTVETTYTLSATFGGVAMTSAVSEENSTTSRWYRTSIFYLVAPGTSSGDIVVSASATISGFLIDAVTLLGAAQTGTLGVTDTDAQPSGTNDTSYTLNGCTSGSVLLAAVGSTAANAPSWSWTTATKDYDPSVADSSSEVAGSGAYYFTSGGDVTIGATRLAGGSGQVGCVAEFKRVPPTGASMAIKAIYYARLRADS
jgi:hypothetical protein